MERWRLGSQRATATWRHGIRISPAKNSDLIRNRKNFTKSSPGFPLLELGLYSHNEPHPNPKSYLLPPRPKKQFQTFFAKTAREPEPEAEPEAGTRFKPFAKTAPEPGVEPEGEADPEPEVLPAPPPAQKERLNFSQRPQLNPNPQPQPNPKPKPNANQEPILNPKSYLPPPPAQKELLQTFHKDWPRLNPNPKPNPTRTPIPNPKSQLLSPPRAKNNTVSNRPRSGTRSRSQIQSRIPGSPPAIQTHLHLVGCSSSSCSCSCCGSLTIASWAKLFGLQQIPITKPFRSSDISTFFPSLGLGCPTTETPNPYKEIARTSLIVLMGISDTTP